MGFKFQKHVACIDSLYFYWVQLYSQTDVIFDMRAYAKQLKALVECAGHRSDHTHSTDGLYHSLFRDFSF